MASNKAKHPFRYQPNIIIVMTPSIHQLGVGPPGVRSLVSTLSRDPGVHTLNIIYILESGGRSEKHAE